MSPKFDDKCHKLLLSMVFQKSGKKKNIDDFTFMNRTPSKAFLNLNCGHSKYQGYRKNLHKLQLAV